jgi:LytS/YehU family sensor histidine kinase
MRVPSLILQPIVENALKHGLAPKIAGGNLSIAAMRTGKGLRLTVEDDGVGLHRNGAGQPHTRSTGVGLANTRQRLYALYGDHATVQMESPDVQGCRVIILIAEPQPCAL